MTVASSNPGHLWHYRVKAEFLDFTLRVRRVPIGSVGSERSRLFAESWGRFFVTDKTLLLLESGT